VENITKCTFKLRFYAGLVMIFAWTISGPIFKTYYNLLDAVIFGMIGVWVAIVGLSQKWLRMQFTVIQLLKMLIAFDIFFAIATTVLVEIDVRWLLLFELLADGPYFALLRAQSAKMESLYLGRFSPMRIEKLKNSLTQTQTWVNLFGLATGAVLGCFTQNIIVAVMARNVLMFAGTMMNLLAIKNK